jgi:MORN repeat
MKIDLPGDNNAELRKKLSPEPGLKYVNEYLYPNGSIYKGQMKNEERHGYGVQVWPDGAKYEG